MEDSESGFFFKSGVICLALHFILVAILTFGLRYSFPGRSGVYTVSIRPMGPPGGGAGKQTPVVPAKASTPPQPAAPTSEKGKESKPVTEATSVREKIKKTSDRVSLPPEKSEPVKAKKVDSVEGLKPSTGKKEAEERRPSAGLQEALDEIRRQAALDKIRKSVDRRARMEIGARDPSSRGDASAKSTSQGQTTSSSTTIPGSGTVGTGIPGAEPGGSGPGSGGGPGGPGSGPGGTKLDEYFWTIKDKIWQEWTIPGTVNAKQGELEAIVVLIVDKQGKLQKASFEKRSGNNLYDQSAMRAVKKAEPFPAFPKELGDKPLEIVIHFVPETGG